MPLHWALPHPEELHGTYRSETGSPPRLAGEAIPRQVDSGDVLVVIGPEMEIPVYADACREEICEGKDPVAEVVVAIPRSNSWRPEIEETTPTRDGRSVRRTEAVANTRTASSRCAAPRRMLDPARFAVGKLAEARAYDKTSARRFRSCART